VYGGCAAYQAREYYVTGSSMPAGHLLGRCAMTLCPIALAVGCVKCPVFKICPAKGIIGDYKKDTQAPANPNKKR
jgi:hypothetical protein